MKAIILAAGEGTRLKPLTLETPKAMVEVFGKPLLAHNMDKLLAYVDEFILVVKYKQEKVREYFGENYKWTPISYHTQGEKKGTGGAVQGIKISGDCFILASDTLFHDSDIAKLAQYSGYGVLAKRVKNPEKYGVFKTDQNGNIQSVVEKPQEYIWNLSNLFFFKVHSQLLNFSENLEISPRGEYEITDALNVFVQQFPTPVFEIEKEYIDITSLEDLNQANNFTLPKLWKTKYIENIGEYEVHLGIPEHGAKQIVDYTLDESDIALRKGTGDWKKRFISIENFTAWYHDTDRYPFTLLDAEKNVVGIWWGRPAEMPHISLIENQEIYNLMQENKKNMHTSGVRIYPSARGKWLATPFIEVCSRCYGIIFPGYCMSDDIDAENIASLKAFEKLWFQKVWIGKNINNSPESGEIRFVYIKKY